MNYLIDPTFINASRLFVLPFARTNAGDKREKIIEMNRNNDYATVNLLDFVCFKKNYKLIAIDLSKQTKLKDPQQISFIGKILAARGATMFFIIEKSEEVTLNSSQILSQSDNNGSAKDCNFAKRFWESIRKILRLKNCMLLTVSQKVSIHTTIW